jgi:hypothetical protein
MAMNMVVGKASEAAATAIVTAGTPSMWAFRFLRFRGVGEDFALGRLIFFFVVFTPLSDAFGGLKIRPPKRMHLGVLK